MTDIGLDGKNLCETCKHLKMKRNGRKCQAGKELNPYVWGCIDAWERKTDKMTLEGVV